MRHDSRLQNRARELRRTSAPVETILWRHLRGRRFVGYKFRRQHVIGPFVVDFYCAATALIIELDGETHLGRENPDRSRQEFLEGKGLNVLRFWNTDVYDNLEGVLEVIYRECQRRERARPSPPSPLPGGERGELG